MPGMTDQQQRDMEAQFRAEIRFARRECDDLRARLESAEAALKALLLREKAFLDDRNAARSMNTYLEQSNKELRARLENVEAALREGERLRALVREIRRYVGRISDDAMRNFIDKHFDATLGATGERSEG